MTQCYKSYNYNSNKFCDNCDKIFDRIKIKVIYNKIYLKNKHSKLIKSLTMKLNFFTLTLYNL